MTTQEIKKTYNLKYRPDIFSSRDAAFRRAEKDVKFSVVMLGENEKFLVVCFADAQRLAKQNFELAK